MYYNCYYDEGWNDYLYGINFYYNPYVNCFGEYFWEDGWLDAFHFYGGL